MNHEVAVCLALILGCAAVVALALLVLRYMSYRLIMAEPDEHADVAGGEG